MKSSDAEAPGGSIRREGLGAALLYSALLLLMAYPVSLNPASMTAPGDPDTDLFMWTLAWNTHAVFSAPWAIFDANIYYPHRHTLAFSENLIGSTIFAAPVLWLTGSHVLALNVVSFSSIVLSGVGAWLLARRLGATAPAALLAGLVFAYSPARFLRFGQLHLTTIQWIPFSLAFLHAYLRGGRPRDLRLAVAFFTLQVLASGHGATFLTVAIVCVLAYHFALGEPFALRRRVRDLGFPGAAMFALALAVMIPYRAVQVDHGLRRDLVNWAPSPESFLASPSVFHLWVLSHFPDAQVVERASAWLFPGILPILLALLAVAPAIGRSGPFSWRRAAALTLNVGIVIAFAVGAWVLVRGPLRITAGSAVLLTARDAARPWIVFAVLVALRLALARRGGVRATSTAPPDVRAWTGRVRGNAVVLYAVLLTVSLLLAAGPPIGLWPLVYSWPGFNFIRVPSRFMILAVLALAILAGFGFARVARRFSRPAQYAAAAVLGTLMIGEFLTVPLPAARETRVEIPPVDRWLSGRPKPFAIVELPTNTYERLQSIYMLHSMAHWQKTVNGHSGIRTTLHAELFDRLTRPPDAGTLRQLVDLGVTYVVVHPDLYWPQEWAEVEPALARHADWLELVHQEGRDRVYRLRQPADPGE